MFSLTALAHEFMETTLLVFLKFMEMTMGGVPMGDPVPMGATMYPACSFQEPKCTL